MLKLLTMKNLLTLLSTIIILCTAGCQKEKLTKETQNGANTFSCKINGKVFKPCKDGQLFGSGDPLFGGYSSNFTIVNVYAVCNEKEPYKTLTIELSNFHGTGEYLLSNTENACTYSERYPNIIYKSTLSREGKVTITKDDRINFILAGTFEFKGQNTNDPTDVINVTSGRFDVKF